MPTGQKVIIAGFGRVGQVVGRLLMGRGYSVIVLEHDEEQLSSLARFGYNSYYGDARREAILRAAGAADASILIVATDDKQTTLEIVETAKAAFPNLRIVARAFDRGHAYAVERAGAHAVVREAFAGAVDLGTEALRQLGFPAFEAERLGRLFRRHDREGFEAMRAVFDNRESYAIAARAHREQLDRVLMRDAAEADRPFFDDAWDTDTLAAETREEEATPNA